MSYERNGPTPSQMAFGGCLRRLGNLEVINLLSWSVNVDSLIPRDLFTTRRDLESKR